jgi:ankyrin repeat protein
LNNLYAWTPLHVVAHEGLDIFYEKNVMGQTGGLWDVEVGSALSEDRLGQTPRMVGCGRGHYSLARLLIQNGANVNARSTYGDTALHKAVLGGHIQTVKLLLEKDADINAKDNQEWTPLHGAARNGNANVVQLLLANKAIEINPQSRTPALNAASCGRTGTHQSGRPVA